ncbi:hypothetical protein [Agrobacterium tumefaciens]
MDQNMIADPKTELRSGTGMIKAFMQVSFSDGHDEPVIEHV